MDMDSSLILSQAKRLFMVDLLREITTGHSGDRIFEAEAGQRQYILRVAEYSERAQSHIAFESHWTEYLAAQMEGVAKPVRSVNGRLYELAEAGGRSCLLSLQEKAPGKTVDTDNGEEFNERLFFNLGMLMGRMHKLTMRYEGNVSCSEFKWNGPHFWRKGIVIEDEEVRQGEKRLLKELDQLPMGKDNYGIVHFDIHTDNFLVQNDKITLIDFDACQFNWYAADIASALFFMVQRGAGPLKKQTEKERTAFAETFLNSYLTGYLQTNSISAYWIEKIDLFMRYQMIDEYVAAQIGWPKEPDHLREWYLNWHRDRIKDNLPYVFIDYAKIISGIFDMTANKF